MSGFDKMVEMMEAAYIQVMGIEKWNSLTDQEKHDAIMMIAKGFDIGLNIAIQKINNRCHTNDTTQGNLIEPHK